MFMGLVIDEASPLVMSVGTYRQWTKVDAERHRQRTPGSVACWPPYFKLSVDLYRLLASVWLSDKHWGTIFVYQFKAQSVSLISLNPRNVRERLLRWGLAPAP
jgi:hypothetical protein